MHKTICQQVLSAWNLTCNEQKLIPVRRELDIHFQGSDIISLVTYLADNGQAPGWLEKGRYRSPRGLIW